MELGTAEPLTLMTKPRASQANEILVTDKNFDDAALGSRSRLCRL